MEIGALVEKKIRSQISNVLFVDGKGKCLQMSYVFDPFVHSGERDKEKEGGRKGELPLVCQAGVVSDGRKKRRTPLGIPCMRASIY